MSDQRALKILLIEDNEIIGDALRDHVAAYGWRVDWVADLSSSLEAIAIGDYDLALLDLRLPDGSGLDFLQHMRAQKKQTPVIILSAYDQVSDRMTGLRLGAIDYLVKPFDLSEMIARIVLFAEDQLKIACMKKGKSRLRVA